MFSTSIAIINELNNISFREKKTFHVSMDRKIYLKVFWLSEEWSRTTIGKNAEASRVANVAVLAEATSNADVSRATLSNLSCGVMTVACDWTWSATLQVVFVRQETGSSWERRILQFCYEFILL